MKSFSQQKKIVLKVQIGYPSSISIVFTLINGKDKLFVTYS